jgi:hypothetical protein
MLTFDSLKFSFPIESLKSFNNEKFNYSRLITSKFIVLSLKYSLQNPEYGLKSICVDKLKKIVLIEVSAKILGHKYYDNFTPFLFLEFLERLSRSEYIKFNVKDILPTIKFYRVDVSKNLKMSDQIEKYIHSLSYTINSKKYNFQPYKNESITFAYNPLSSRRKLRFIFYDKYKELLHDKIYCKSYDISRFKNVLRYEINLTNYFVMRRYLHLTDEQPLNYENVICNETNIFKNVFLQLYNQKENNIFTFNPIDSNIKISELEKNLGSIEICKQFNYDFKKVSAFLRNNLKGNIQKYYHRYSEICSNHHERIENENHNILLNQIYNHVA